MNKKVRTLLIGAGCHAKRIYIPYLKTENGCKLVACLDLEKSKERVETLISTNFASPVFCYFTKENSVSDNLKNSELTQLNNIVKKHKIEAVIISTEPLAHFKYVYWAIKKSLHVLLDKPITTEISVSTDSYRALKLYKDYEKIDKLYQRNCKKKNIIFNLQAQRRYHKGFQKVREKIKEITELTHCPVTFIQAFHSDGQWTFPNEFVSQSYHPYNQGYGKMSHSGYHSMDIALWLALASLEKNKYWNNYSVFSQFIRPKDVVAQFNEDDFRHIFPEIKNKNWDLNVRGIKENMGEVDALISLSLCRDDKIITSISCNALHHSFSARGWYDSSDKDLYKGNGRIRQESYIIEQGAFQSIVINSFQSSEIQKNKTPHYNIGGEYHYEVHIFRNNRILKGQPLYEKINIKDLKRIKNLGYSRGHQEDTRRACIDDFYQAIIKDKKPSEQISNIIYHSLSTQILSSIYLSAAQKYKGHNNLINNKIKHLNKIYGKKTTNNYTNDNF